MKPLKLAICEAVDELFPDLHLWPSDTRARRITRSICADEPYAHPGLTPA